LERQALGTRPKHNVRLEGGGEVSGQLLEKTALSKDANVLLVPDSIYNRLVRILVRSVLKGKSLCRSERNRYREGGKTLMRVGGSK